MFYNTLLLCVIAEKLQMKQFYEKVDDPLKNNFTTTLRHARNNYFQRKFTECSNNSRDTWKTLNSLIQYKNTSKDVILNHMAP